jgi:hypothetical protein
MRINPGVILISIITGVWVILAIADIIMGDRFNVDTAVHLAYIGLIGIFIKIPGKGNNNART